MARAKLSPEARAQYELERNTRWRRYGMIGGLRFVQSILQQICYSSFCSQEAREAAKELHGQTYKLIGLINPKGPVK